MSLSEQAAIALMSNFREDAVSQDDFLRAASIELRDIERQFEELSLRYTAKFGFRTYDLLHVASALVLKCDTFWSFDPKASKLASWKG